MLSPPLSCHSFPFPSIVESLPLPAHQQPSPHYTHLHGTAKEDPTSTVAGEKGSNPRVAWTTSPRSTLIACLGFTVTVPIMTHYVLAFWQSHLLLSKKICSKFHTTHKNWFLGHNLFRAQPLLTYDVILHEYTWCSMYTSFSLISFNRAVIQIYFIPMRIYGLCLSMSQFSDTIFNDTCIIKVNTSNHFWFHHCQADFSYFVLRAEWKAVIFCVILQSHLGPIELIGKLKTYWDVLIRELTSFSRLIFPIW